MLPRSFRLGRNAPYKSIGGSAPCFIIAEAGVNHNGDPALAHRLIDAAIEAGADAVKFQTFKSELLVQSQAETAAYQKRSGSGQTQLELLTALELSERDLVEMFAHAKEAGILFLSTPFDEGSADFLDRLDVPAFKIGSGDVTSVRLLAHVAAKKKPVLLSTGMSSIEEVSQAINLLVKNGTSELALFHCVSSYPAQPADANLKAIDTLRELFKVPTGYSDHHQTNEVTLAAVARGAQLIEKHITLDKTMVGPDHSASLNPSEFRTLVEGVRLVESALGTGEKIPCEAERDCRAVARRSLVTTRPIKLGEQIVSSMLTNKRPATGISPLDETLVLGSCAATDIPGDALLSWDMITRR